MCNLSRTAIVLVTLAVLFQYKNTLAQACPHPGVIDRYEHVRAWHPSVVTITFFDGKKIDYVLQDGKQTKVGSVEVTSETFLPKDFAKNYRKHKHWWIIYCSHPEHMTAYRIALEEEETTAVTKKEAKP